LPGEELTKIKDDLAEACRAVGSFFRCVFPAGDFLGKRGGDQYRTEELLNCGRGLAAVLAQICLNRKTDKISRTSPCRTKSNQRADFTRFRLSRLPARCWVAPWHYLGAPEIGNKNFQFVEEIERGSDTG